jgi:hypothetical protein
VCAFGCVRVRVRVSVRVRVLLDSLTHTHTQTHTQYSGVLQVAKEIMQRDGVKGFYKGLTPVLVRY